MDQNQYELVVYKGKNLKDAHKKFEQDVRNWMARGYILDSREWIPEHRGVVKRFLLLGVQSHGELYVTYELPVTYVRPETPAPPTRPGGIPGWRRH
jgi:hypothetical protein